MTLIPKVSVIVPIYNPGSLLHKCLDSLSLQTLTGIEFILVNDGSTDHSGKICDEYAKKDKRFRLIHQKNSGSAVARQAGLNAANGEYVIICDSDDWVEPEMYEYLLNEVEGSGADIIVCGYYAEYPDGKSIPRQTWFLEKDGYVDNDDFIRRGAGSSWIKLIKRSLFEKTGASYEPGINMGEDALILYKLMKGNPKVKQIRANLYHYRRLPSSRSYTNNIMMSHILQMDFTYRWFKDNYSDPKYEPVHFSRALDIAFACLRVNDADHRYLKEFLKKEIKWKRLIFNKKTLKAGMITIEKIFSYKLSKMILRSLYPFIYK